MSIEGGGLMVKRLELKLSETERAELVRMRDSDPRAYRRERAAALLKIANGQSARQVALHYLNRQRDEDTVYGWVHRYKEEGVAGLDIRKGRGRKPSFSPSVSRRGKST